MIIIYVIPKIIEDLERISAKLIYFDAVIIMV